MTEYNWKLINSFSIPAGIITGLIFTTGLNAFLKYLILIVVLAAAGLTIHNLAPSQKKPNAFTSTALIILIVIIFHLFKNLF